MTTADPTFCALVESINELMPDGLTRPNILTVSCLILYARNRISVNEMRAYIAGASQADPARLAQFQKVLSSMEELGEQPQ